MLKKLKNYGKHFNFHPLVLEDIVNISQRPKIDEYEDYFLRCFKDDVL